jgi:hypothetical protein
MILGSVFDTKSGIYSFPQPFIRRGDLTRAWHAAVNDPQSAFGKYPADYTMFIIGEWDDRTGKIIMYDSNINIGNGLEFKDIQHPEASQPRKETNDNSTESPIINRQ